MLKSLYGKPVTQICFVNFGATLSSQFPWRSSYDLVETTSDAIQVLPIQEGQECHWISAEMRSSSIQHHHHFRGGLGGKKGLREGRGYEFKRRSKFFPSFGSLQGETKGLQIKPERISSFTAPGRIKSREV